MKNRYLLTLFLSLFLGSQACAQWVSLTTLGTPYTQDFNSLITSGSGFWINNFTIGSWYRYTAGTGQANNVVASAGALPFFPNTQLFSFGTGTATDRALGLYAVQTTFGFPSPEEITTGAYFQNNTGSSITSLAIQYTGEQWYRTGLGNAQSLIFEYSTDASGLNGGTWTAVPALQFDAPNIVGGNTTLDGNLAGNFTIKIATISGLNIINAGSFFLRWRLAGDVNSHGLGIDDISVTPAAATTWNGTAWSSAAPTAADEALLNGDYNTATDGNLDASNLTINAGKTLTIGATGNATIVNTLTNNGIISNCANSPTLTYTTLLGNPIEVSIIEPTLAASALALTNVTPTTFTASWTNGNGSKRIVIVKPTAAIDATQLTDGIVYTADANFLGVGDIVDGTGKVVYNGSGNTVNISGLTAGVVYDISIFEYNGGNTCGTPNYRTIAGFVSNTQSTDITTWNGIAWDNGTPTATKHAVINGNYDTRTVANITANSLVINVGFILTISNGGNVIITNQVANNGAITRCNVGTTFTYSALVGNAENIDNAVSTPTDEASGLSFSTLTNTSFTINWTNGATGNKRIVVVKPTTAVNVNALTSGTYYIGNPNFGAGTVVDATAYIVYAGAGNSITVTNLLPNATYQVAVFQGDENSCGVTYKLGSPLSGNQITTNTTTWNGAFWDFGTPNNTKDAILNADYSTIAGDITANSLTINVPFTLSLHANTANIAITNALANNGTINNCLNGTITQGSFSGNPIINPISEPTVEASAISFSGVTSTGFTVNWTNGNGAKRIVVVKPTTSVNVNAVADGAFYIANPNFTAFSSPVDVTGKVVYANNGNSITVTGLTASTTYHVAVFEYNENFCGTNYKTGSPLAGSQVTNAVVVIPPLPTSPATPPLPLATPPTALNATFIGENSFQANWKAPTAGASYFQIDVTDQLTLGTSIYANSRIFGENIVINGLKPYTTYYYRLRTVVADAGGNISSISAYSNIIEITTSPAPPKALEATKINFNDFTANWETQTGATYLLDAAFDEAFQNIFLKDQKVEGTNFIVSNKYPNGEPLANVYYRIRAVLPKATSNFSNVITVIPVPKPPSPSLATDITATAFTANWQSTERAEGYLLEVTTREGANTVSVLNQEITNANTFSFSVTGLKEGKSYFYRLRASNKSGLSDYSAAIEAITLPSTPSNLSIVSAALQEVKVNWTASIAQIQPILYIAQLSQDEKFSNILAQTLTNSLEASLIPLNKLEEGEKYFVRLYAIINNNGISILSEYAKPLAVVMPPARPILNNIGVDDVTENSITLSWEASKGAESYEITTIPASPTLTTVGTKITIPNLNSLISYQIFVSAANKAGKSAFSLKEVITLPNPISAKPATNIDADNGSFLANWEKSTQTTTYRLEVSTNENFNGFLSNFPLTIENLIENKVAIPQSPITLYYRVRAVVILNGQTLISRPTNKIAVKIIEKPSLYITDLKQKGFRVNWNLINEAKAYEISIFLENTTTALANYNQLKITETSIEAKDLEENKKYQIKVKAIGEGFSSGNSTLTQLTLPPFPNDYYLQRVRKQQTTSLQFVYALPYEKIANLKFTIERGNIIDDKVDNFQPIVTNLLLETNQTSFTWLDKTFDLKAVIAYRLKISNEAGEVIFNLSNRIVTAVENDLENSVFMLYPNPTSNIFMLAGLKAKTYTVSVYDNAGRLLKSWGNIQDINYQAFDISTFAAGRYIVEINWEKEQIRLPLIKE